MAGPPLIIRLVYALVLFGAIGVLAAPMYWDVNGHYYERVDTSSPINWNDASGAANTRSYLGESGYLATVTSGAEQNALFTLLGGVDAVSHHWFGGFQSAGSPEAGGGWQWVTGEPWVHTNWGPTGEPNNSSQFSTYPGEGEDGLQMHFGILGENPNAGHWNDFPRTAAVDLWTCCKSHSGYIVEYDAPAPVPEPSTLLLLASGAAGLGGLAWKRHRH